MKVTKRNGSIVDYDAIKICKAVERAFDEVGEPRDDEKFVNLVSSIVAEVYAADGKSDSPIGVEAIQDIVENQLMEYQYKKVAKAYIRYRYDHELKRQNTNDKELLEMVKGDSDYWNRENSNKNVKWVTTQRDYIAGIVSTDFAKNYIFPKKVIDAHNQGIIHIHDMDYALQHTLTNCCLINLNDMLQNGTVVNGVMIEKPHRISTAMTIATQIIAAVASSQYGGCSITLTHLAPFVRDSFSRHYRKYISWDFSQDKARRYAKEDTRKEVQDSVQTLNYQLNSLTTTNGQAPFISIFMYMNETEEYKDELAMLIEEVLKQRILGMKNKVGVYVTTAFPKLLYVLEDDNITPDGKYWYLTELAAKCTAKRMVPDYISEKIMKQLKLSKGETEGNGDCYACMGCRSFLTPDRSGNGYNNIAHAKDYDGKPKYWGRFNIGVCTINLADAALSSGKDLDKFWRLMEERTEMCHTVQRIRAERLAETRAEVAPILWCDGAFARLQPQDYLRPLIYGGYCTSSLGFSGLYECVKYMTGYSHTQKEGHDFGIQVMQFLNDKTAQWKAEEDIDYSLYGSPIEATTYNFAKHLQERFGKIEGITDRNYITNSYHVPVFEKINIFDKFAIESEFQKLSPGGAISYAETTNLQDNIEAVEQIMQFIYNHIMYAELNTKSDYCQVCGYDGEIELKYNAHEDKHYYECPNCGNRDFNKMNIARRVCGYISTTLPCEGRLGDIADRYVHVDDHEVEE